MTDELTPVERRAFEALPREASLPADLEDRTVALLRRTGHLPTPITVASRHGAKSPSLRWIGIGAVAAAMIFASGMALGQYMGMRNAALVATASAHNAAEAEDRVTRSGDHYVAALASLAALRDTTDIEGRARAREAALRILGAAAEEVSHRSEERRVGKECRL